VPETSHERATAIRAALREITAEYGHDALSSPATMSNLVKDLLPDDQQMGRILVVAAEQQIPDALRGHVSQGMDVGTAARLVASSFAASTLFAQQACASVVGELAIALGLGSDADLSAGAPPAVETASFTGSRQSAQTAPTSGVTQSGTSGTVPAQRQASGPSPAGQAARPLAAPGQLRGTAPGNVQHGAASPDRPARSPARHWRSRLAIAAVAVLAVLAGAIILLTHHGTGSPLSSPGAHQVNRQFFDDGSLTMTLTTISVSGDRMTVDVVYRNTTSTSRALGCAGYGDPSIVTISLAGGRTLHATKTYCSDHPLALFAIGPRSDYRSYAVFKLPGSFPQPFSFHWPYGSLTGSVSGIRI
jgi:hypothetical protein